MNKKFAALGALAGVVAVTAPANAGMMAQTKEFTINSQAIVGAGAESGASAQTPITDTLTFDLFDPTLGTLDSVKITSTFAGSLSNTAFFNTTGNEFLGNHSVPTGFVLEFELAGEGLPSLTGETAPGCEFQFGDCRVDASAPFSEMDMISTTFGLASLTGPGTFDIDIAGALNTRVEFFSAWSLDEDSIATLSGSGDVTVAFTFTEAPTPVSEPGTLTLLGVALGGLGMARKRHYDI